MDRISTASTYSGVLANLMAAESQQTKLANQVSSEQVSTNLKGYGSSAETLTAMQSVQAQVTGYLSNATVTAAQLSTQDTALTQVSAAASSANSAVTNALATGTGDTLMPALQDAFQNAVQGLNTSFNGAYAFSGGNANTAPVSVSNLSDLTAAPSIASVFTNGSYISSAQLTSSTSVQTGQLASQLGTPLFTAMQAIEAYNQGPNGPFSGALTAAQTTFLQGQITSLTAAATGLTAATAQNGQVQKTVASTQTSLGAQQTTLNGLIGGITQVNLAQASAALSQAQSAIQASAQVFEALQSSSLLSILTASGR
jgi:flagellar hook-associated protein 3 FlgL